jgi:Zn-dependent protease with chaperone function
VIALLAVPVLIGLVLCLVADRLARSLRPGWAVVLLTALALSVALCTGIALSVAAVLVGVQLGPLPRLGHWSVPSLRSGMGFPDAVGLLAMVLVSAGLGSALVRGVRTARALIGASRTARGLRPAGGRLVLLEDPTPLAYSVLGFPGRIVVSTAMLAALSADERRVLLAHEASHLRHGHQLYAGLVRLAAAANPLLRPVADAVGRAVERAADEDAAAAVGDRRLAARALTRAALARAAHAGAGASGASAAPSAALAAAEGSAAMIADRVRSLLAPPVSHRRLPVLLVLLAGVASWTAALVLAAWGDGLVEIAEAVYARR